MAELIDDWRKPMKAMFSTFLDLKNATVVQRVNVDFPSWMVEMLDQEAVKMNVSRQAIIKMWIRERLDPSHRITL
ncbi:MAG: hypothetical protein HZB91_02595 [Elusimicrobia bacterium]|nr:hypothetical protein [Elusimicrobiota bacterium]